MSARERFAHWAKVLLVAALFVTNLLASPVAPAQSSAPNAKLAPSPTVDEIVERYVAARGGIEKLRALKSLRQEGRVHAGPGRDGVVMREIKRPGKIRFEFTVQGVTSVFASDGERGWKVSPLEGETGTKPLPAEALIDAREQADIDGPLVDWKSKGSRIEIVGREAVGGQDAWKVQVTLKSGGILNAWLDVKSANLVKTEATRKIRGHSVHIETTFGDYRKTAGILFPGLVEVRALGRPQVLKIVVDKVEVNPALSDARFTPPA